MNGKPRILHICSDTNIGGAGRYVLALLTQPRMAEQFETAVACPEGDLANQLRRAGIPVLVSSSADTSFSLPALRSLIALMRTWRPQVVHTHGSLAGRVAAAWSGARIVYTKHGLAASDEHSIQVRGAGRLAKKAAVTLFAHRIVAVSDAVKRSLIAQGADPGRIVVIPGGVDLSGYAAISPLVPDVIGAMGRLEREKGFDVLLQAMTKLNADAARLLIGGDGSQREALSALVRDLGLQERVEMKGFISDVPGFHAQTGMFVLASRTEGMGLVFAEAMAAGRPVVATRVGGVPEVVVDGETGLLVPPDDPGALADAVGRLLADPTLAARMGEAGRRRALELFSAERMADRTAALYVDLLK